MGDFFLRPLLDRNELALGQRGVEGRDGRGDVKGNAAIPGRQGLEIGADLVAGVAVPGDAVGADDDEVDLALLHQVSAGVVDDQRMRNALLSQFESRERGALVARPSLVDEDMDLESRGLRLVDRRRRRAPVDGGQPAGVAMGEDAHGAAAALVPRRANEL